MPRFILSLCLATLWLAATNAAAATFPANDTKHLKTCKKATESNEKSYRLPKRLLNAISLAETGRWHSKRKEIIAWPWTVYSEGRGRYLPTKEAAIAEVKALQAKGVKNIDVGCMQVNLYWHPNAFDTLEEAFDPVTNAAYAASLLKKLRNSTRSWTLAVAYYHSQTKKYYVPYRKKVLALWQKERRKDTNARMAKAREEYRKRREAIRLKMEAQKRERIVSQPASSNS